MHCRRCNTFIPGNYCPCCGLKVRSPWEEYRLAKNAERKRFRDQFEKYSATYKLADLCWNLAHDKYGFHYTGPITDSCFLQLATVSVHAKALFDIVVDY